MVEPGILEKVLQSTPEQMVKFKVYIRDVRDDEVGMIDRRLTRIKNQNKLPVGVWAKMVVESILKCYLAIKELVDKINSEHLSMATPQVTVATPIIKFSQKKKECRGSWDKAVSCI